MEATRAFFDSRIAVLGLIGLLAVMFVAIFAPWIAPQDPYDLMQLNFMDGKLPPGSRGSNGELFLLGSDDQGRDILSAILYGLRTSLAVGAASAGIAFVLGSVVGLFAAYAGGWIDALVMRIVELQLSLPAILIALVLVAILGQGTDKIIIALVAVQWAYYARTIRAQAMIEKTREYIEAGRMLRYSTSRIVLRHLLPNCLPPLIVLVTMQVAAAIALEATLSFLGIGLPLTEPSLGLLISNGYADMLSGRYWLSFYPGLALLFTIVSINLVGDQLRDVLNPKARQQ
ncbi:MAG: ABC transporter permease [Yoonia sp.]|uniref:ABC transporter permease n=1 Tax=Yoonia sp. TaxID=2212373 RepID=UPI00276C1E2D|nr:ABC transporter permease [Yoonia sp.]